MKVAVVGAGWAGLACAVEATRSGDSVTLFEATRMLGGRARSLPLRLPDGSEVHADNGQHILIGAYTATLALMRDLDVDIDQAFLRMPLRLRFADGGGLSVPRLPAPLDLLVGIVSARGWAWRDKAALIRTALLWRRAGFRCPATATVADLCGALTPRVIDDLVEPLCVSALNTPMARASGEVFLRVLQDALFGPPGGADMLLPRVDLGALMPDAAARWLDARGAQVRRGHRVRSIAQASSGWTVDGEPFERVVLACPPWEAARIADHSGSRAARAWAVVADALEHEAISTVYMIGDRGLPAPLLALRAVVDAPAQFAFDRGRFGGPEGLLAFVVSASPADRELLQAQVLRQAAVQLGRQDLRPIQTVVERRATFACTPGLVRPCSFIDDGLAACGDYVAGPYPATLEGAVRSGLAVARQAKQAP